MTYDDPYADEFEIYEELFDPLLTDRKARRKRKPKARHVPKKMRNQIIAELADDTAGLEGGFNTTYQPSRYEQGWLLSSLRSFYERGLLSDVLALVKGGKEASVYRCAANPVTGATVLAAKVYRPRKFRNLRNDGVYRQGRAILNPFGRDHDYARDQRILRAVGKKTAFGFQVQHTSWLMHEYTALERLHQAGAAVPRPVASSENAILMSYHGDEHLAAPTLSQVSLETDEAASLFKEVLRNVQLMLQHGLIHGDLSAYNILYWEGKITLIDFPQVTDLHANDNAYFILQRDVQRICEYFARQGVPCDAEAVMGELWYLYGYGDL
jgi:RIO kinase 1